MSPEQKVKIGVQCILTITFLVLCIISFTGLLKADTSLAFSKGKPAYFPSFTICPMVYDLKGFDSFDTTPTVSIGDFLRIKVNKVGKSIPNEYNEIEITERLSFVIHPFMLSSQGMVIRNCTSVDLPKQSLTPGTNDYLQLEVLPNNHFNDFGVVFHEKNEFDFGPSKDGNTYYVSFAPGKKNYIELHMSQIININSNESPCEEESIERKGYLEQLNEMYLKGMNCTLPWLKGKSKICESQEDFEEFRLITSQLTWFSIDPKCDRDVWKFTTLFTRHSKGYKEDINGTMVAITMPSNEFQISQQVRLYTMTNFIADFGGYLGLLLGASVMSFFDIVLICFQKYRIKG